ncbi:hypothetical protein HYG81_18270 [Natrinema zhouii]|uniref:Uncharacterized protein n=1 Tax=Natrinema zhouii TaxID=1710539 RepID=A0A7D6CPK6_9EURY|nr:hypothetical protein [Natrinema zhouii]QLK25996.1 hypothetical protein HYG81_18270 [Natrinema zhouii]
MNRTLAGSAILGFLGGLVNVAVTRTLLTHVDSPFFELGRDAAPNAVIIRSIRDTPQLWIGVFALGFVPLFITASTRLLAPTGGFAALLGGVAYVVLTSPFPQGETSASGIFVNGPFYASNYAKSWYAWLSLLLVAGVAEFALRRGYGLRDGRLRHLPDLSLSRSQFWSVTLVMGALVGLGVGLLNPLYYYQSDLSTVLAVLVTAGAATWIALAALLSRGLVTPLALDAYWAQGIVAATVFPPHPSPESHTHPELLFLFLSVAVSLLGLLELAIRSRYRGWDGGSFTGRTDTPE